MIDLLIEKIDSNELDLYASFNLHYCDEPFILKLDHLSEKRSVFNCSIGHYEKNTRQNFSCYHQQSK